MLYQFARQNREDLARLTTNTSQLAGIRRSVLEDGRERGLRIADINNGSGLQFTVLIDRGLDIGQASFRGVPIAYLSPTGFAHPAYYDPNGLGWLRSWGAGLLSTCGLRNVGAPDHFAGENHGLHGRITNSPAENCACSAAWVGSKYVMTVAGSVREARLFGENLLLSRKISSIMGENTITIEDTVENQGCRASHLTLLYHINLGYPLLSPDSIIKCREHKLEPRDETAAKGLDSWSKCQDPTPGYQEQCFYHDMPADPDGFTRISMLNPGLRMNLELCYRKRELPFFVQWKQMGSGEYVMGFEPANCHVEGVNKERQKFGTLQELQPGESISTLLHLKASFIN